VVDVLLRFIRVVPPHLFSETAGVLVVVNALNIRANDSLERMEQRAGTKALNGTTPFGACAQVDGVVIPVREPKPQQEATRRFGSQRVDEFLSHQTHGRCTEDDDTLLVQPNDTLIGPEVEQFGKVQIVTVWRMVA
jgi:hypothetical protein